MAASPSSGPQRAHQIVMSRGGVTRVFDSDEEARAWAHRPLTEDERRQFGEVLSEFDELRDAILERTDGRGITQDDVDDALRVAKDH